MLDVVYLPEVLEKASKECVRLGGYALRYPEETDAVPLADISNRYREERPEVYCSKRFRGPEGTQLKLPKDMTPKQAWVRCQNFSLAVTAEDETGHIVGGIFVEVPTAAVEFVAEMVCAPIDLTLSERDFWRAFASLSFGYLSVLQAADIPWVEASISPTNTPIYNWYEAKRQEFPDDVTRSGGVSSLADEPARTLFRYPVALGVSEMAKMLSSVR